VPEITRLSYDVDHLVREWNDDNRWPLHCRPFQLWVSVREGVRLRVRARERHVTFAAPCADRAAILALQDRLGWLALAGGDGYPGAWMQVTLSPTEVTAAEPDCLPRSIL